MLREAVYLPEGLDEFLYISQVLNVQKSLHRCLFHTILLIFCFWNACEPTYASFCHSEQHFSLLHLTSMLLLLTVFSKTHGAAYMYFMTKIAGLLSRAVLEGDWTRRTVWTQTILTERRWNGDGTETWRIVWIGPNCHACWQLKCGPG